MTGLEHKTGLKRIYTFNNKIKLFVPIMIFTIRHILPIVLTFLVFDFDVLYLDIVFSIAFDVFVFRMQLK